MMTKIKAYLELARFPNLFTAMADIIAGVWVVSIALERWPPEVILLLLSSVFLYATGVILNDYADIEIDRLERPERPLPSGRITRSDALYFGMITAALGVVLAAFVHWVSLFIALCLLGFILLYDFWMKHHNLLGPLVMGLCRSFNLLLGMSIIPSMLHSYWWLSILSLIYIFTVTSMAKGEVGEGLHPNRVRGMVISVVICLFILLFLFPVTAYPIASMSAIAVFAIWAFSGIFPALTTPSATYIRPAVGKCITGLPLLSAAIAALFGGWMAFFTVGMFLFLTKIFSRMFTIT